MSKADGEVDYARLTPGIRVQIEEPDKSYVAQVIEVSTAAEHADAPVKVRFLGWDAEHDQWVGADRLRSKALTGAKARPRGPRDKEREKEKRAEKRQKEKEARKEEAQSAVPGNTGIAAAALASGSPAAAAAAKAAAKVAAQRRSAPAGAAEQPGSAAAGGSSAARGPNTGGAVAATSAQAALWGEPLKRTMDAREQDWRIGPVVYQVFVDRFAPPADFAKKWSKYPQQGGQHKWEDPVRPRERDPESKYCFHELDFWGGDLPSLLGKLDYVKDLADVLYLQPVHKAFSNHKYDADDYMELDPQYGTLDDFQKLVQETHSSGMKLVLDTVFNHTSTRNPWFKEAMESADSEKRKWYFIGDEHGKHGYKIWGGAPNLAELRLEAPDLRQYLWESNDSVVATWLKRGADGCRIDVASEIGFDLLASLTRAAHRHKRGSLVVCEVWCYGPRWSSSCDAVLSLHMGQLIYGVVKGQCSGPSAVQHLDRMIADSSIEEVLRSWIVLSNHDLPRLANKLPDMPLRKLAVALQFTWPGAPLIYYGDELGLQGGEDPLNRAPMPWSLASYENEMLRYTKQLIGLRRRLRALRIGNFRLLHTQQLMAFARYTEKVMDLVVVVANTTDEAVEEMVILPMPNLLGHTQMRDVLAPEAESFSQPVVGSTLLLAMPPKTLRILALVDESAHATGMQYKRMYGHWATFSGIKP